MTSRPSGAGAERVRVLERKVHETVARPHRKGLLRAVVIQLHRDTRAREDVEDLLLRGLEMKRRRPLSGVDPDALGPEPERASRVSDCQSAAMCPCSRRVQLSSSQ